MARECARQRDALENLLVIGGEHGLAQRQGEGGFAVAAIRREEKAEERLVQVDGQKLTVGGRPTDRAERGGREHDLAHVGAWGGSGRAGGKGGEGGGDEAFPEHDGRLVLIETGNAANCTTGTG